ncbi:DinB family protein [Niastella caeni]|uniref:DinB family protein n=1 Tax=Niastella caeni TaxID=2569763 RepID=A0A4S8HVN0_9BACT|nr:DinB family protein [Niastella caeni]THU38104.1 DinB family protein [Niastella caeni]
MNLPQQIATHFRTFYAGGNWTDVNLKDSLAGVDWELATTQIYSCNTIATLVFHMNYYVSRVLKVFQGQPLDAHDNNAFDLPPINSEEEWESLRDKAFADAEAFANLIEQLPESKFEEIFVKEKYGNYYRNIHGIIEHNHYHLGQIVLLKKIIAQLDF